jgi:autotransporter-associated beta strand protein
MQSLRRVVHHLVLLTALSLLVPAMASAATHTWIGPSGGAWSTAANWSGASKPTSGEVGGTIVQFGSNTTSTMDIPGLTVDEIRFTGAKNTINGSETLSINGSTLVQNIVSEGAENKLASSLHITLVGASTELSSSTGMLTVNAPIAGTPGLVFAGAGGSFALYDENTYTGPTVISSGALHIAAPVGLVIVGSSITVGTGVGPGAQLVLDQSSDISKETALIVNSDGVVNFQGHADYAKSLVVSGGQLNVGSLTMLGGLVMNGGSISLEGQLAAGSLSMTGGTISAPGAGAVALSGNFQATSSASGPATVTSGLRLNASPTVTVTPGTAPELRVTGPITETGGSRSLTKSGAGTMLSTGANTYTGTTTVSAGTLVADGSQPGPLSVGSGGTVTGSGTFGATTVEGVLAPSAPGLTTGQLTFGATGRLNETLDSFAAGAVPSAIATGPVTIEPSAALNLVVSPGIAAPHGSRALLIDNRSSEAITGHFSGVPSGSVLSTAGGVPLAVSYAAGDGNDLSLTAGNVPPQAGPVAISPSPVRTGEPVALSVSSSDANLDPLTTTWTFGDGSSGVGGATSHVYAAPGVYTVIATVSDGLAQVQSTALVTVDAVPASTPPAGNPQSTSTASLSAYGADFSLTYPHRCVRAGSQVTLTMRIKKRAKVSGHVLAQVVKVTFAVGAKTVRTIRSSPFRALLTIARASRSGSTVMLRATAYVVVRGAGRRTRSIRIPVRVC